MAFEADLMGQKVRMDASVEDGGEGSGAKPKPLLLAALAGCSGIDVVSILQKMREPLSWFDMGVEGEVAEDHPRRYTSMRISYRFKESDGLDHDKVLQAVKLSQDKYCGVSALFRLGIPVDWEIRYL
jgi:putative redox protein